MIANGKTRKTLADQLDRTLDGLAEAFNESVADAVREAVGAAVRQAVQATLQEMLTNPDLRDRVSPSAGESGAGPQPECRSRHCAPLVWEKTARALRACGAAATAGLAAAGGRVGGALAVGWRLRWALAGAAGVGVLVGVGCYLAGPLISAGVGGLGGFATALATKALLWLRRHWPDPIYDRADF
jgi:hypothetical protein